MGTIDNHEEIAEFIDEKADDDTFWYTELINRSYNGTNKYKILRSFEHRDRAHFMSQWPIMQRMCDRNNVRAYTRLAPRSRKQVAYHMARSVMEQVLNHQYGGLFGIYSSSCAKGIIKTRKVWFFDIDSETHSVMSEADRLIEIAKERGVYLALLRSKTGLHVVTRPHHITYDLNGVSMMKNNPNNLYVPEDAE